MSNPGSLQQHHPRQQSSHPQLDTAGGPPTSHPTGHEAAAQAVPIGLDQGVVVVASSVSSGGGDPGELQHNGDGTPTGGVRQEYEGDGNRTVTSLGEDKTVTLTGKPLVLHRTGSPVVRSVPSPMYNVAVRSLHQHQQQQSSVAQQQRPIYPNKRAMSPQTYPQTYPSAGSVMWQNPAAMAAAAAAASAQGLTQFFPSRQQHMAATATSSARFPPPQPYPAYPAQQHSTTNWNDKPMYTTTPRTEWQSYPPMRSMPPPSPSNTGSGSSGSGSSSQQHSPHSQSSTQSSQHGVEKLSKTNLYIRGLPLSTTDEDLVNLCSPYGKIVSTKAIMDKLTARCKGYGFVDFENAQHAATAVEALQSKGILAQMAKAQEQDPTNLYLSNLPKHFDEKHLEEMLAPYGQVISTRILRDSNTQLSRGVGFARMESKEKCEEVITKFNGFYLPGEYGQLEPLLCKFADGGVKKRNQYNKQQQQVQQGTTQWTRTAAEASQLQYDGIYGAARNGQVGLTQAMVSPYTLGTPQMSGYPVHATSPSWVQQQYVMQPHMTPVSTSQLLASGVDQQQALAAMHNPTMVPQITQHMNQLQLAQGSAYVPTHSFAHMGGAYQAAQMMQPVTVEGDGSALMMPLQSGDQHSTPQSQPSPHQEQQVEEAAQVAAAAAQQSQALMYGTAAQSAK
ncbi:RNA-binding motif, single-stranded-interacting protein 2-like isoform X2 [Amphiura filiformis]|uniref:RNA-binding motif, single-stranded-interacting protein 2-like isoform X2 n=1 Tax=Amphiura filiformis TaxID=82378 RepID=UPI003B217A52